MYIYTLPGTNSSHLKIGFFGPKGNESSNPTIDFQRLFLLVSGRVYRKNTIFYIIAMVIDMALQFSNLNF